MTEVKHIDVNVSDFIPTPPSIEDLHPDLFAALVPNFRESVKFALIEVLELDREISKAKTWVYFGGTDDAFQKLVKNYFSQIDQLFKARDFSISSADEFYFGNRVFFSRINTQAKPFATDENLTWAGPYQTDLRRDYQKRNSVGDEAIKAAYNAYVDELGKTLLNPFPVSYVLLVPVALNHTSENHQRKIGAVFLHFGLNCPLESDQLTEDQFAQNVFKGINLYWHYRLTAESLYKQIELAESAKEALVEAAMVENEFRKDQDRFQNDVSPVLNEMENAIKELGRLEAKIKHIVKPHPHEYAKKALNALGELMSTCFPSKTAQDTYDPHDPCGHPNLEKLDLIKIDALRWTEIFSHSLDKTSYFKKNAGALFLGPITNHYESSSRGGDILNDPLSPHPALCLAKCISHQRIPIAWLLVALGCQEVIDDHWRLFIPIELSDTTEQPRPSVLDVIYAIGHITSDKLLLTLKTVKWKCEPPASVHIELTPQFDDYSQFLERMAIELTIASPSGGTAIQLGQLLRHGYTVEIQSLDGTTQTFKRSQNDSRCVVSVKHDLVMFTLKPHRERFINSATPRDIWT